MNGEQNRWRTGGEEKNGGRRKKWEEKLRRKGTEGGLSKGRWKKME